LGYKIITNRRKVLSCVCESLSEETNWFVAYLFQVILHRPFDLEQLAVVLFTDPFLYLSLLPDATGDVEVGMVDQGGAEHVAVVLEEVEVDGGAGLGGGYLGLVGLGFLDEGLNESSGNHVSISHPGWTGGKES
jgi:hypothetical protein